MSDDNPLFSKMDALLKKHRAEPDPIVDAPHPPPETAPPAWLPVLTQVIERGAVPPPVAADPAPATSDTALPQAPSGEAATTRPDPHPADTIAPLLQALVTQMHADLKQQLALDLQQRLDQAIASFSIELETRLREILGNTPTPPRN